MSGYSRWRQRRTIAVVAACIAVAASAVGCAPTAGTDGRIALLLPDRETARYETFDRPQFEARVAELGDFDVLYSNADQDQSKQQTQAEAALAQGAKVLVLDPVDAKAAASIVNEASAQGVPVISYDRLIAGGRLAYYISFDNEKVGRLQATGLAAGMTKAGHPNGGILMVNGSPTDSNAVQFSAGARSVLEDTGLDILASFDTPGWSPDKAQQWVSGQIAQYGDRIDGVYAANDGVAGGAISALKAANVSPMPVVTGQDAELSALQRIVSGDQYMTVYKAIKPQARRAADVAVALLRGEKVTGDIEIDGTPATLLEPKAVTVSEIMDTVVADGFWTVADICTPEYEAACAAAGIG